MNSSMDPSQNLSLFNNILNKQIMKVNIRKHKKAIQKELKQQNKLKKEAKYIYELIRPLAEDKKFQQEVSSPNKQGRETFGYLKEDVFSFYFKIIEIQNYRNKHIFNCLPFKQNKIFELKINFPFYLYLEQVSNFQASLEKQKNLFSLKQLEIPQEIIEFIVDNNQIIMGCNRIVNKCWLKMLGINSDMIIHYIQQYQTFPIGWIAETPNNLYQDFIKSKTICLTNYSKHYNFLFIQWIEIYCQSINQI